MVKIDLRPTSELTDVASVSGRVEADDLPELAALADRARAAGRRLVFDLGQVSLVDREVVSFFSSGPGRRAQIDNCPTYLRAWLTSEGREEIR